MSDKEFCIQVMCMLLFAVCCMILLKLIHDYRLSTRKGNISYCKIEFLDGKPSEIVTTNLEDMREVVKIYCKMKGRDVKYVGRTDYVSSTSQLTVTAYNRFDEPKDFAAYIVL